MLSESLIERLFPETLTMVCVSGNMVSMPRSISGNNNAATGRVRQHRATAGLIRVEIEVPTREDALAVRRFAQARRRVGEGAPLPTVDTSPAPNATTEDDLAAVLAGMDAARQAIALQFVQALAQPTDPDMLVRGRRVALNFADAVAQRRRDRALCDDDVIEPGHEGDAADPFHALTLGKQAHSRLRRLVRTRWSRH
jgi:hypothetical protein